MRSLRFKLDIKKTKAEKLENRKIVQIKGLEKFIKIETDSRDMKKGKVGAHQFNAMLIIRNLN